MAGTMYRKCPRMTGAVGRGPAGRCQVHRDLDDRVLCSLPLWAPDVQELDPLFLVLSYFLSPPYAPSHHIPLCWSLFLEWVARVVPDPRRELWIPPP